MGLALLLAGQVCQAQTTAAEELAATPPGELLADWRATRAALHDALLTVAEGRKLPWFGPPMSAASMATARLMETWAHGLDVADALSQQQRDYDTLVSRMRAAAAEEDSV